ncbi:carboxylate--amine ligase [Actinomadura livida]|uniref:Putative ATP-grasp superfamily ATP-dependent carboligase n=1 Tax=Actinomadura livida TaxID=79909 RepID=A0A7W7I840_9ACTN|nr:MULTISPECIES: ATP-grasp domain-containing protein [Actinomadura]MBB4772262.1 putative ATP-grasp superfamily ATP-dependent carboligase [Actinomadura catellatispora]GGU28034.1 ATP-grasp domain-containing protein [Actinomadura livida]
MFFDTQAPPGTRLDAGLPVLLLRTDRNVFHHGTLGVIRSLGRAGVPVHAILEGRANPASRSRYLYRGHPWAPPAERPAALLSHLRVVGERIGGPALLVPVDDAGAIFIAEHADALAPHFVFPHQDSGVPRLVADKALLAEACERHGITFPPSRTPASAREVDEAAADLGLPLIAKWARPWRLAPGMRSTTVVRTLGAAHRLFGAARDRDPDGDAGPLILQRRIPTATGDWFFQGYFDESLGCLFGGTGRKHLAHPPQAGHTVAGEWVPNPELRRLAVRIVRLLGCRGLVDLDFRYDAGDGAYHLLDFNPRIGAQFRLFTDRAGLDLARVLHLHQSGRRVPGARPAFGRNLLVENHYLQQAAGRPLLRPRTLRPLREADEFAWYAGDDLPPFLAMGRQSVLRAVERLRTR